MENASKALIIAGAILLAIVLVSLGVLVINNARKDISNQNIDQATVDAFNSKINAYCGEKQSGTDVNNLIDIISASNGAQKNKADKHYIGIFAGANGTADSAMSAYGEYNAAGRNGTNLEYPTFDNSKTYKVRAKVDANGYIYLIKIYW